MSARGTTLAVVAVLLLAVVGSAHANDRADDAARDAFRAAQALTPSDYEIVLSPAQTADDYLAGVARAVAAQTQSATRAARRYDAVLVLEVPQWSVAALVAQAQIYEQLAAALRTCSPPRFLPAESSSPVRRVLGDAAQQALRLALDLYVRADELATRTGTRSEESQLAAARVRQSG